MRTVEIWINPACQKCRTARAALDEAGVAYTERRYLDQPPTADELREVVARLGLEPWDVARPKEAREAGLDLPRDAEHRAEWYAALAEHPRVIQRPIITTDDGRAVIARDAESLDRVLRTGN